MTMDTDGERSGFERLRERVRVLFSDDYDDIERYARHLEVSAFELAGKEPPPGDRGTNYTTPLLRLKRAMLELEEASDHRAQRVPVESDPAPSEAAHPSFDRGPAIDRAVKLRDRMESMSTNPDDIKDPPRVFQWFESELLALLGDLEVSVIDDEGEVDPTRHEVVDTRPAGPSDQVDHIAATVRVGYATSDHLVRPQTVIAFVKETGQW